MEDVKLGEKIHALYDMELNDYLMLRALRSMDAEINRLGKKTNFGVLQPSAERRVNIFNIAMGSAVGVAIFGAIIGLIYGWSRGSKTSSFPLMSSLEAGFDFCLYSAIVGLILGFIIGLILKSREDRNVESQFQEAVIQRKNEEKKDLMRVEKEVELRRKLQYQRGILDDRRRRGRNALESFYKAASIDEKYQNLVPIAYMDEFFRLGVSRKLEGPDGLYYLVRQELRADQFQLTLEEISSKLDVIIDQQRDIYMALVDMNAKCDRMIQQAIKTSKKLDRLEDIAKSSEIAAYNSQRIAAEGAYMALFMTVNS